MSAKTNRRRPTRPEGELRFPPWLRISAERMGEIRALMRVYVAEATAARAVLAAELARRQAAREVPGGGE
jgi:hypothetical protein